MARKLTLGQALTEVNALLHQLAWSFSGRYGLEQEDLYGHARQVLADRLPKWNPERGRLTTFATWAVRNALHDYCQRAVREVPTDPAELPEDASRRDELEGVWRELRGSLSWEGMEVVEVVTQLADDGAFDGLLPYNRQECRARIKEELMLRGWGESQVRAAVAELKVRLA